jgi:hypothetical protein
VSVMLLFGRPSGEDLGVSIGIKTRLFVTSSEISGLQFALLSRPRTCLLQFDMPSRTNAQDITFTIKPYPGISFGRLFVQAWQELEEELLPFASMQLYLAERMGGTSCKWK